MQESVFLGALAFAGLVAGATSAQTLEAVQERGRLNCGVSTGLTGFAAPNASNEWEGFDVAFCRAVAAAIFDDPTAVEFVPLMAEDSFGELAEGGVDLLARNTAWTFSRDNDPDFDFAGVNYYDGQGFMVPRALGAGSALELGGRNVCVQTDTPHALNLGEFFRANNMEFTPVPVGNNAEAQQQYLGGACDVYTTNASALAATRATFEDPSAHAILPEIISKEPLGPVVRHGDDQWADIVRWTLNALIAAEEFGVTSANVEEMAQGTDNPEINRLLGTAGDLGAMLGLEPDWAVNAIQAGGNYGELFQRYLGESTPIGLARGLNAQWTEGGLLYAPPFR